MVAVCVASLLLFSSLSFFNVYAQKGGDATGGAATGQGATGGAATGGAAIGSGATGGAATGGNATNPGNGTFTPTYPPTSPGSPF